MVFLALCHPERPDNDVNRKTCPFFYVGIPLFVGLLVLLSKLFGDIVVRTQAVLLPVVLHFIGKVSNGYILLGSYILVVAIYLMWNRIEFRKQSLS